MQSNTNSQILHHLAYSVPRHPRIRTIPARHMHEPHIPCFRGSKEGAYRRIGMLLSAPFFRVASRVGSPLDEVNEHK